MRPAPILRCPTSEFPICPSGRPTPFKSDPNPKMKELSSIGGAVWDGYIPFAKRYAAQNKFSDTAIAAAKNAVASQPLEGLIQPLLNCRDNPKNRITVR